MLFRSVAEAGETFLRLQLDDGKTVALGEYSYAGTGQHWYEVLETKPYRVDVWLNQQMGILKLWKLDG